MTLKRTCLMIIALLVFLSSNSQNQIKELISIDNKLTDTYKAVIAADYESRYDSLAPLFRKQLQEQLTNQITFNNSLDSLSKYLTMKTSTDKKLKFYSWDDLSGGTWHNINCIAQFKTSRGKIIVQQISSGDEAEMGGFTDSEVYDVNEITIDNITHYLTFAWGTHGSGNQHQIIQLFKISNNELVNCKSCFPNKKDLVIQYPRNEKLNLSFNPKTNEISYNEFRYDDVNGFYKPTGRIITLILINAVFTPK